MNNCLENFVADVEDEVRNIKKEQDLKVHSKNFHDVTIADWNKDIEAELQHLTKYFTIDQYVPARQKYSIFTVAYASKDNGHNEYIVATIRPGIYWAEPQIYITLPDYKVFPYKEEYFKELGAALEFLGYRLKEILIYAETGTIIN